MQVLRSEQFYNLTSSPHPITLEGKRFNDPVIINGDNCKSGSLTFINCDFQKGFIIDSLHNKAKIGFENTVLFNHGLKVNNSSIFSIKYTNCKHQSDVVIENTNITSELVISHSNLSVLILNNIAGPLVSLFESNINSNFKIENGIINKISISSSIVPAQIGIYNVLNDILNISNSTFEGHLEIDTSSSKGIISSHNTFKKDLHIIYFSKENLFNSKKDIFQNDLVISASDESTIGANLCIEESQFNNGLKLGDDENNLKALNKLELTFGTQMGKRIIISDIFINELKLNSTNYSTIISLNKVIVNHISFDNFYNLSDLNIVKLTARSLQESTFRVYNSHLGKTRLIDCNLDSYQFVQIHNSQISEIIPVSLNWFSDEKFKKLAASNRLTGTSTSDILRQLKVAVSKQGDTPQTLRFKSMKYEFYRQELKQNKTKYWDRIILWLSRTNDYGQNWIKPIVIFMCITIFFFVWLAVSISNKISFDPSVGPLDFNLALKEICNYFYLFPHMFNPARSLERLIPDFARTNPWTFIIDVFHKIIYAFFIYQTIKAFRKYSE